MKPQFPTCPDCGKPENTKEVCLHCGHVYEEADVTTAGELMAGILCVAVIFIFSFLVLSLFQWLDGCGSLHEIIIDKVKYLLSLEL